MVATTTPRRAWVDFAKGAAILMVVYYHTSLYLSDIGVENTLGRIKIVFELFPMPVFFLVSGLFGTRIATWGFKDLWRRRLLPLLWLYVVWSILRTIFYLAVPFANGGLGEFPATNPLSLILLFFWPSSSYWFIYGLALFTLGAWAMRKLDHRVQIAIAAVISTIFTTGLLNTTNIGWNRIGALFVFYLVGVLYSKRIIDYVEKHGNRAFLWVVPIFLALAAVLFLFPIRWVPFVVLIAQFAAVALGILVSRALVRLRFMNFVTVCGERSLHIYLIHLYVIVLCTTALRLLVPDVGVLGGFEVPVLLVFMILAVVLSLAATKFLSRFKWLYVPPMQNRRKTPSTHGKRRAEPGASRRDTPVPGDPAPVVGDAPTVDPAVDERTAPTGRSQKEAERTE